MRTDRVKNHFEEEAKEYDLIIQNLIPNYNEMIESLVSIIPFSEETAFSMIDLGCGTGTISKSVKARFPKANVTCVDIAEKMLEIAKVKIGGDAILINADFNEFEFPHQYDLIVSSLALHHLETDNDKRAFYRKIFSSLAQGGAFINIDVVLGSDDNVFCKEILAQAICYSLYFLIFQNYPIHIFKMAFVICC